MWRAGTLCALGLAAGGACPVTAAGPVPLVGADGRLAPGWREARLPGQPMPPTRYAPARIDERDALRLEAERSYGNLVLDTGRRPAPRRLRWAWRLDRPNEGVALARKSGDDAPAKVCLAFDLPAARLPLTERVLLALARQRTGDDLPTATLCWVWGHAEPAGTVLPNAYTRRVRFIVLRNRDDTPGRWVAEERDVEADLRRAFGDEIEAAEALPPLTAVLLAADADNTGGHSVAHVADLVLEP